MMRQYELLERVQDYKPDADEKLLNKAYIYAMQKHGEQKRANGDPYFSHPLEVAAILTNMRLDEATIATALLHDTIEDTDATRHEIDTMFGEDIGALVDGLTKIQQIDFKSKQVAQAENLRKLLLAVSSDVRVLLVKLADRLHNMRTLHFVPENKRARISQETMDIYAPLAGRIGMQDMREELEDLAFQNLQPEAYAMLNERLNELVDQNSDVVSEISQALLNELKDHNITAKVYGRQKRPYSIFRKMEQKALSFEQLSDIFGFRIIVSEIIDCYRAIGAIHIKWQMVPGRFKDYISMPKQNDYRSLHTTIIGPNKRRVELQVRTNEMHSIADYGVAAHTLYKDNLSANSSNVKNNESQAFARLRRSIEMLADGTNAEEFLENTKLELFFDKVFCFTPKGMVIALPRGATPIDFAYAVHTQIGDSCVGCKINGRISPVTTELRNGNEVEIIRSVKETHPANWEASVVTGKARAAIRRIRRINQTRHYVAIGKSLLGYMFNREGQKFEPDCLMAVLPRFDTQDVESLIARIGKGELAAKTVMAALELEKPEDKAEIVVSPENDMLQKAVKSESFSALSKEIPMHFPKDGGALPGDRIVGILEPEKGVTIYPVQSSQLADLEDGTTWFDMQWDLPDDCDLLFPASIQLDVHNIPGALAKIAETVARYRGNIVDLSMTSGETNLVHMIINLQIPNLKNLNDTMNDLRAYRLVSQVKRRLG